MVVARTSMSIWTMKLALLRGDSSNVDLALTRFCTSYTQVFLSDSNHLKRLVYLVAGTGFEPVTFRL